jgi:hypothetical protein
MASISEISSLEEEQWLKWNVCFVIENIKLE